MVGRLDSDLKFPLVRVEFKFQIDVDGRRVRFRFEIPPRAGWIQISNLCGMVALGEPYSACVGGSTKMHGHLHDLTTLTSPQTFPPLFNAVPVSGLPGWSLELSFSLTPESDDNATVAIS